MDYIIIDVREPEEFAKGHVKNAINIPPADLLSGAEKLRNTPKDAHILVYCMTGSRSNASIHILRELGFVNCVNGINKQQVEAKYGL